MDFRKLAEDFFFRQYEMKKSQSQQKLDESLQGEIFTLFYLNSRGDSVIPSEISREMSISSARVASILNNLEKKSFIERQIDKSDRRRILVNLTEEGREQAADHYKEIIDMISRMLKLLGEEDARDFVRITERILELAPEFIKG